MVAVSLVDGMGEVMVGMFCVLVDMGVVKDVSVGKDGVKDVLTAKVVWKGVLIGMVNIVVSSEPVILRMFYINKNEPICGLTGGSK